MRKPATRDDLAAAFRLQATYCRKRNAVLTASIVEGAALDIEAGGPFAALFADFTEDPGKSAAALRIAGAVHYLVIKGRASGAVAALYDEPREVDAGAARDMLTGLLKDHRQVFDQFTVNPPQTNEINRVAALLPALSEVASLTGLPLDLYELGASGGLLLAPDYCAIDYGSFRWGDGPVQLKSEWRGAKPEFVDLLTIGRRFGCDRNPIDFSQAEQCDVMHSYIWPEHEARRRRFDAAVDVTRAAGARVEKADAIDWLGGLAIPRKGAASVVFTSVFAVYLSDEDSRAMHGLVQEAGAAASADAPLAFVQFEPDKVGEFVVFNIDLTLWPGGERRRMATAQSHGEWVAIAGAGLRNHDNEKEETSDV
ncbi:MAG: DUF2332 domain-containing protein [Pseudomonadota bacterium]